MRHRRTTREKTTTTVTAAAPFRVVIADDVADLRYLMSRALEATGRFEVVAMASNGREAVDEATEHRPDLTLLDLGMPVLNGLEALPLIRDAVPESTVVVVSGFEPEDMEAVARARGAAGYLVKGLGPRQLVAELLILLDDINASPVAGVPPQQEPPTSQSDDIDQAHITLPPALTSGREARVFVADRLAEWRLEGLLDTALLLTSELVTNAVVHARSPVSVTIRRILDRLRVEVADVGGGALVLRNPSADATGGRGLQLMDALAASWGTSAFDAGKLVWFELTDPPRMA